MIKPGDAKFVCDKCGMRGISSAYPPHPKCHICNYTITMRKVEEPEYSHGNKNG